MEAPERPSTAQARRRAARGAADGATGAAGLDSDAAASSDDDLAQGEVWQAAGVPSWLAAIVAPRPSGAVACAFACCVLLMLAGIAVLHPRALEGPRPVTCADLHGSVSTEARSELWQRLDCDRELYVDAPEVEQAVQARADGARLAAVGRVGRGAGRSGDEDAVQSGAGAEGGLGPQVIALCVATTTRGSIGDVGGRLSGRSVDIEDLKLSRRLLPSLVNSAEAGFEYWVYVVYDDDDRFFAAGGDALLRRWFDDNVAAPLAEASREVMMPAAFEYPHQPPAGSPGVTVQLALVPFANRLHLPGPAFNVATQAAFDDGADFIYRVTDDTQFVSPWASRMVGSLRSLRPPLLGVVGPTVQGGRSDILTMDMVHRSHHEVFRTHYPTVFTSWWMDDWITRAYGGLKLSEEEQAWLYTEAAAWRAAMGSPSKKPSVYSPHFDPDSIPDGADPEDIFAAVAQPTPPSARVFTTTRALMLEHVVVLHEQDGAGRRYSVDPAGSRSIHHEVLAAAESLERWARLRSELLEGSAHSLSEKAEGTTTFTTDAQLRQAERDASVAAADWARAAADFSRIAHLHAARLQRCVHQQDCV